MMSADNILLPPVNGFESSNVPWLGNYVASDCMQSDENVEISVWVTHSRVVLLYMASICEHNIYFQS